MIEPRRSLKRNDLVYAELHYKIAGILFEVFRTVGPGYKEKYYQKAVATGLRKYEMQFREQVPVPLLFQDKRIGINFLDFLIEPFVTLS